MSVETEQQDVIFEARDLRIRLEDGGREIVRGVDFTVPRGQVVALIGESGSGKTTIALSALGYIRPGLDFGGGAAVLEGPDLTKLERAEVRLSRPRRRLCGAKCCGVL